jgi:hypothetical protein
MLFAGVAPDLGCYEAGMIELGTANFELPSYASPKLAPLGGVWIFSENSGIRPDTMAANDDQVAFLGRGGSLSQSCDGFDLGRDYHLHLVAHSVSPGARLELLIDGLSLTSAEVATEEYRALDFKFTASSDQHDIALRSAGNSPEIRLDAVNLTELTSSSDSDRDQLLDKQEFLWFDDLRETAAGDADGDGSSNLVEQLLDLDPTSSGEYFRSTIDRPARLQWPGTKGLTFSIERSQDLSHWEEIGQVPGITGKNEFIDPAPLDGVFFYRIRFNLPK